MTDIHLGFEVGTGEPVSIPLKHTAVTGMTQESGKTTCLEALASRIRGPLHGPGVSLAFITKRGEGSFAEATGIQPYFRDRADWVFVDQILSAQLQEKNKWLRQFIIKICRTTSTLADVQQAVRDALLTAKGVYQGAYTQLDAYLDLIVPEISRWKGISKQPRLNPGINVMDVSDASTPMQMLFVQSAIDWVNEKEQNTVVVVPEAWEFIPEGKGSPVKASAIALARKGAVMGNYIWVDSQDMAGVDKTILRACTVWLIGVQREANEIKRNLSNIPHGMAKPSAKDVALLERGQFYACWGKHAIKTYVQPAWMPPDEAAGIARGTLSQRTVASKPGFHSKHLEIVKEESFGGRFVVEEPYGVREADVKESEAKKLVDENKQLNKQIDGLTAEVKRLSGLLGHTASAFQRDEPNPPPPAPLNGNISAESLYAYVRDRLSKEAPKLLKVLLTKQEIEVKVERATIEIRGDSLRGRMARLIAQGFFENGVTGSAVQKELARLGKDPGPANTYKELDNLAELEFLTVEGTKPRLFKAQPDMLVNVVESR